MQQDLTAQTVRRRAKRLGYVVRKSRERYLHSDNRGQYMLIDAHRNSVVLGVRFDATPNEIAEWLSSRE